MAIWQLVSWTAAAIITTLIGFTWIGFGFFVIVFSVSCLGLFTQVIVRPGWLLERQGKAAVGDTPFAMTKRAAAAFFAGSVAGEALGLAVVLGLSEAAGVAVGPGVASSVTLLDGLGVGLPSSASANAVPPSSETPMAPVTAQAAVERLILMCVPFFEGACDAPSPPMQGERGR